MRPGQLEQQTVDADSFALMLKPCRTPQHVGLWRVRRKEFLPGQLSGVDVRQRVASDCHLDGMPRMTLYPAQARSVISLRGNGSHQYAGRGVVRLQILRHDKAAH